MDAEAKFRKIYNYLKKHDFQKTNPATISRAVGIKWATVNIYLKIITQMNIFKQLTQEEKHYVSNLIKTDRERCIRQEEIDWRNKLIHKLI